MLGHFAKLFASGIRNAVKINSSFCLPSRCIGGDDRWAAPRLYKTDKLREDQCPVETDVLVVGGGLVGMSVAFWLRWNTKIGVTVIERDPSYMRSASITGLGSIRQQFSQPELVQMSLFCSEFLRNARQYLSALDGTEVDIEFNPQGCLLLANQEQAEKMKQDYELQTELGAKVELLNKTALQERWPWLNVSDVEFGCYGFENEGWFDPGLLLRALHTKCSSLGVNFVVGEVLDFEPFNLPMTMRQLDMPERPAMTLKPMRTAVVSLSDGPNKKIKFANVVNAAGPWAADLARMVEIGSSEHFSVPLPVEPRLQRIYVVRPKRGAVRKSSDTPSPLPEPGLDTPFIIDYNGLHVQRRDLSGEFIVYSNNELTDLTKFTDDPLEMDVDYAVFHEKLGKQLANRIPSLASVDIVCAWTGVCDYNPVDGNWIVGSHSCHWNMYLCNGSSGHGAQHAIAVGRAIFELLVFGHFKTIDLTRFSFDRFYLNHQTVKESNT